MKKFLMMLTLSGMVVLGVQTQPVIEFENFAFFPEGKIITKSAQHGPLIAMGENVVWDFSGLTPYEHDTLTWVNLDFMCNGAFLPGGSMYGSYPNTNYTFSFSNAQEVRNFYISNEGYFSEGGGICEGEFTVYTDLKQLMDLPFTYFSEWVDDYEGTVLNQPETDFSGNISTGAPAYGTLILPNFIYSDVLMLVSTDIRQQSSSQPDTTVKVCFFTPSIPYPVLEITNYVKWVYFDDIINSSDDYQIANNLIEICPNPVKDYLTVCCAKPEEAFGYEIIDLSGHVICRVNNLKTDNGSIRINFTRFAPGTYFLKFFTEGSLITRKVVKI